MDDNRKLARELFLAIEDTTESMPDDIDRISAYGEARYKAGVEAVIVIAEKMINELRPEARVNYPKAKALDDLIEAARLLEEK